MATEILRPNAAGDENAISFQVPADSFPATDHWNKVDEETADDDTTYIQETAGTNRDLYNLPASSGSGVINFIKIYFRCKQTLGAWVKPSLKSNATVTDGTQITPATSWTTYSEQWNTNPADAGAWEWADIDALQIGIQLTGGAGATSFCTQLYVEVDYTPAAPPGLENKSGNIAAKMVAAGLI